VLEHKGFLLLSKIE